MNLPNELFLEVASHLKRFKDLNSLVRTSSFFHGMFNIQLYRRAVAADDAVLNDIVGWVLSRYRLASLILLLDNGLSVNHTGRFPRYMYEGTMLCFLCSWLDDHERSVPLARLLIQRGADMEMKCGTYSETAPHEAIFQNNWKSEIAVLLQTHGADPNAGNMRGGTPLHLASGRNNARMVNLLLAHGAAVDARNVNGDTPLLFAVIWQKYDVIPTLLAHGADAGVHNKRGHTPLHYSSWWFSSQHHELAKSLLEHGASVNATNNGGVTPLHWASAAPQDRGLFMVKFLFENGADVNAISKRARSPLQSAFFLDNQSVAALLLEHGAVVRVLNS
jgi:ankyrin repeat protein